VTTRPEAADELAKRAGIERKKARRATQDQPDEAMPPPQTEVDGLGRLTMAWPEHNLEVRASHISNVRGGIEARLAIRLNGRTPTAPFRLNVLSMSARDDIIRKLRAGRKDVDWTGLINHICQEVHEFDPDPKPVDLTSHQREADTQWLLEPFVRVLKPTLLYSEGGMGKSTFAMAIAISLATGEAILPGVKPLRSARTAILDWESDEDDTQEIMEAIADGANVVVPAGHIIYRRMSGTLPDHYEAIQKDVTDHGIELVVTDSIIAAGGEEGDRPATAARAYFDVMRALRVASLGITHLDKASERLRSGKPYGSVYYWNLARSVWRLRQEQEEGESEASIGLFHEKSNRGEKCKPLGWRVTFGETSISFGAEDVTAMPEVGKRASTPDQIVAVLRHGALHIQDIYAELPHIKETTIRQSLFRKTKTPRFVSLGNERWGLAGRVGEEPDKETDTRHAFFRGVG